MAEANAEAQIRSRWPSYTWALNISEIRAILSDPAITDPNEIQARIAATNWWKGTQPAIRNWEARQSMDPAGANQDRQQKEADIWDLYLSIGLQPNPNDVRSLAEQSLRMGWSQNQVRDAVVTHMNYSPEVKQQVGSVQTSMSQLKQAAADYYVPLDDQTAFSWGRQIAAGEKKAEDFIPLLQTWSKSRFAHIPTLVGAIDAGVSAKEFLAPWRARAAELLETAPDAIDLLSPKWSEAFDYADPKSGERRMMTFGEFDVFTKNKDEYWKTQQGRKAVADQVEGLLQTFGQVAA